MVIRRDIPVGARFDQVSPPTYYPELKGDMLRGALFLAYQQNLDGLGGSAAEWMGLTEEEYAAWMANDTLPKGRE